ncbi:MAG: very short patch repair endonuclease [Bacteroidota bacterium]
MRAVKSAGNVTTELNLIRIFRSFHITGWRRNYQIFGKPDFVFPKKRVAVFADGCFWHGHTCRNLSPRRNAEYWKQKVIRNRRRDALVRRTLFNNGWVVVRLWECQISKRQISRLTEVLKIRKRN